MKKTCLISGLLFLLSSPLAAEKILLNRIVAKVNNEIISQSSLQQELDNTRQTLRQQSVQLPAEEALKAQVLERLILEILQQQQGKQLGIYITDEELNTQLRDIAARNNLTLKQLQETLNRRKGAKSWRYYREAIQKKMIFSRLRMRQVERKITVSEQEIQDHLFMQQRDGSQYEYALSHLLIATPDEANTVLIQEKRTETQHLLKKLQQGTDFTQLTISHSDGSNALEGGDLGWRKITQLPEAFVSHIVALNIQAITPIIRTPGGFHLLQLRDKRPIASQQHDLDTLRLQAKQAIHAKKSEINHENWLNKLRDSAYVKFF